MEAIARDNLPALVWQPVLSPLHVWALAALLGSLALVAYARTMRSRPLVSTVLLAMRLAVVAALTVILMGPSELPPRLEAPGRPRLWVLADTSGSMRTPDCAGRARLDFARDRWLGAAALAELDKSYEVRHFSFDGDVRPAGPETWRRPAAELAVGRSSRIAASVRRAIQRIDEAGETSLLVLSDGHDTDEEPMQPVGLLARARGVAVHTVCLGGPTLVADLFVVAVPEQQFLLAGEQGHILVKVHQVGMVGAKTTLHLSCGGKDETRPVDLSETSVVTLRLPVRQEQPGTYEYRISADPLPGEDERGNNLQCIFLEVTRQRLKVLLLEGEPFWETKFLAQSLRKDARIDLTQVTQLARGRQEQIVSGTPAARAKLPATAEELAAYDVIVLGRGVEMLLAPETLRLLPDYVAKQGGHVIFARGRAYDAETPAGRQAGRDLAVIEPVVWGRGTLNNLSLAVTSLGRSSPPFAFAGVAADVERALSRLPGFAVMPAVEREKTAALVLAQAVAPGRAGAAGAAAGPPAVVAMDYGRGRVVAVLGEGLWRWGFLPADLAEFDGVYDTFWSNLVRWLAMGSDFLPGEDISLRLGQTSVRLGDAVLLDVVQKLTSAAGGAEPKVKVVAPDAAEQAVVLKRQGELSGRLQGSFVGRTTGVYSVVLEALAANPPRIERRFSVYQIDLEKLQASAQPQAMRTLAETSGGLVFPPDQPGQLPAQLARLRARREAPRRAEFVWDKWLFMAVLLAWAGVEWICRRKAGLL